MLTHFRSKCQSLGGGGGGWHTLTVVLQPLMSQVCACPLPTPERQILARAPEICVPKFPRDARLCHQAKLKFKTSGTNFIVFLIGNMEYHKWIFLFIQSQVSITLVIKAIIEWRFAILNKLFLVSVLMHSKRQNIGLTIPGNWSFEIRRISGEIRTKSAGFHECELLGDHQV